MDIQMTGITVNQVKVRNNMSLFYTRDTQRSSLLVYFLKIEIYYTIYILDNLRASRYDS